MFRILKRARTVAICALVPLSERSPAMMQKSIAFCDDMDLITLWKNGTHLLSKKCRSLTMRKLKSSPVESSAASVPGQSDEASRVDALSLRSLRRDRFFKDCIREILQH